MDTDTKRWMELHRELPVHLEMLDRVYEIIKPLFKTKDTVIEFTLTEGRPLDKKWHPSMKIYRRRKDK